MPINYNRRKLYKKGGGLGLSSLLLPSGLNPTIATTGLVGLSQVVKSKPLSTSKSLKKVTNAIKKSTKKFSVKKSSVKKPSTKKKSVKKVVRKKPSTKKKSVKKKKQQKGGDVLSLLAPQGLNATISALGLSGLSSFSQVPFSKNKKKLSKKKSSKKSYKK